MTADTRKIWTVSAVDRFDFCSDEYRLFFARAKATGFQSPAWLQATYDALASNASIEPLIIVVRDAADGALAAVAPLIVRKRYGLRVVTFADIGATDYCAVVCSDAFLAMKDPGEAFAADMRRILQANDALVVSKAPGYALAGFDRLASPNRWAMSYSAHPVPLSAPFTVWRAERLDGTQRRSMDKKRRKLSRIGKLKFLAESCPVHVERTIEQIRAFREHRFRDQGRKDPLQGEAFRAFYAAIGASGAVRAYQMLLDGKPIAAAFAMVDDGVCHLLLSGFDSLNYRNYSVGLLIVEDAIADSVARGERVFDFTIGDHAYKRGFGVEDVPMWRLSRGFNVKGKVLAYMLGRWPAANAFARRFAQVPADQAAAVRMEAGAAVVP
jgi:CelD/BcsL family acetyltransferase involved in cellulose biosynthesis